MIDMGQSGPLFPPVLGFVGSATALLGGVTAYATSPDASTGTAGLYVGTAGLLMGAATMLGVIGDKWLPHFVQWAKIRAEAQEEYRKNREARHRLADELQKALATIENMKEDFSVVADELRREAAEAKEKANRSENVAIRAATKLAVVEKQTQERLRVTERGIKSNTERLDVVESKSDEVLPLPLPTEPPGTPP